MKASSKKIVFIAVCLLGLVLLITAMNGWLRRQESKEEFGLFVQIKKLIDQKSLYRRDVGKPREVDVESLFEALVEAQSNADSELGKLLRHRRIYIISCSCRHHEHEIVETLVFGDRVIYFSPGVEYRFGIQRNGGLVFRHDEDIVGESDFGVYLIPCRLNGNTNGAN